MTTEKPQVVEDDLCKACAKVGRFLYEFALVEGEINSGIVQILDLKGDAAEVVANGVDFMRKANLLLTVALETAPEAEKESIGKLFRAVADQNNKRIIMAHSMFEPAAANEDVQFRRTVARDGKVNKSDPLWTKQNFEDSYKRLRDIRERLTKLRPMLKVSISEDGKTQMFRDYFYPFDVSVTSLAEDVHERPKRISQLDAQPNKDSTDTTKEKPAESNS